MKAFLFKILFSACSFYVLCDRAFLSFFIFPASFPRLHVSTPRSDARQFIDIPSKTSSISHNCKIKVYQHITTSRRIRYTRLEPFQGARHCTIRHSCAIIIAFVVGAFSKHFSTRASRVDLCRRAPSKVTRAPDLAVRTITEHPNC